MNELVLVGVAGFAAAFVDGAAGMGFGPTSTTILMSGGMSPQSVSATVNLAKVASGLAAGVSHWRFGNIDRRLVLRLAVPGAIGAVVGLTVLNQVDRTSLRPWLAALLVLIGTRMLIRFGYQRPTSRLRATGSDTTQRRVDGVSVAGFVGGITNALVGAWGPVTTPYLLHRGVEPRITIGSVNTAEVAVAAAASTSLIGGLSNGDLRVGVVVSMMVGGIVGAPVAAWAIRYIAPRVMGIAASALLLFTNSRELAGTLQLASGRWIVYGVIALAVVGTFRPRLSRSSPIDITDVPEPAST
jgi:uncharacterized protein